MACGRRLSLAEFGLFFPFFLTTSFPSLLDFHVVVSVCDCVLINYFMYLVYFYGGHLTVRYIVYTRTRLCFFIDSF